MKLFLDTNYIRSAELDSTAAIRLWAQELINLRIQELINEDEETMDIEEARAMVHETIRKEYALP